MVKNMYTLLSVDSDNENDTNINNDNNNSHNNSHNNSDNSDNDGDNNGDNVVINNININDISKLKYNKEHIYKPPIYKNSFNKFKDNKDNKFDKIKKYNQKKILCQNYITYNSCTYGNKCSYAHNLNEQNIDPLRKQILDLITNQSDLSYITKNLKQYKILTNELLIFTKLCEQCILHKCIGGYNCKNGSCKKEYLICYEDLNYGSCKNLECTKIHLSKRNMKPIQTQIFYTFNN